MYEKVLTCGDNNMLIIITCVIESYTVHVIRPDERGEEGASAPGPGCLPGGPREKETPPQKKP